MRATYRAWVLQYAVAVVSIAVALLTQLTLDPLLQDRVPLFIFLAAIVVTAYYGGLKPTLLATLLGILSTMPFYFPTHYGLIPATASGWLSLALFLVAGVTIGWLGQGLHDTRRLVERKAEEFRAQLEHLYGVLNSFGNGVIVTDTQGQVISINTMAEQMTGWARDLAIGMPQAEVFRIVHEVTRDDVANPVDQVLREGKAIGLASRTLLVSREGNLCSIDLSAVPIRDTEGELSGVLLTFRNVTERQRWEAECAQLAALLTSSEDAILSHNLQGLVTTWNQGAERLYGFQEEEVLGKPLSQLILPPDRVNEWFEAQQRVLCGERLEPMETVRISKQGQILHVSVRISAIYNSEGEIIGISKIDRDISAQKIAEHALRESEERLRLAMGASQMGIWEWNISSDELHWSANLEQLHGLPPGGFEGTFAAFERVIHPADRQRVIESIRNLSRDNQNYLLEYRTIWPDGSLHWVEMDGELFCDEQDRPIRILGIGTDITDRRQLNEELQSRVKELEASEERIQGVVNHVPDAIITIDDNGIMQTFNPAAERLFGWSAAEIIGQNVKLLMPEPYHGEHDQYIANYLKTGAAKVIGIGREVVALHRHGMTMPVELAVSEFHLGSKRFFSGILHDITERKRTEATLRFLADASKSLAALLDDQSALGQVAQLAVPDFADFCMIHLVQADGTLQRLVVKHVDPKRQQLVEYLTDQPLKPDGAYGPMRVFQTGEPELLTTISDETIQGVIEGEEAIHMVREFGFTSSLCLPLKHQGKILGVLSFAFAESGRRYRESDLGVAQDLAHRIVISLENARLYREVRESDRHKDEFVAMLAHELRNPLAPIRSGLDILALEGLESHPMIELMQQQIEHLVRLVDDLLDMSRILRGHVYLRRQPIELSDIVEQATEAFRLLIEAQHKTLQISMPDEPLWLNADRVRLIQVLENLLGNALKYTDQNGHIVLEATHDDKQIEICVRDNGIGIEPELLPKIFDLFTQDSRALDRAQGGLGIGLTLVRNLVELHDGEVSVQSEGPGKGSQVYVRLPLLKEVPQTEEPLVRPRPESAEPRRVMVVDDNRGAAHMLATLIRKLGQHEVQLAHDGPAALVALQQFQPDIVLLDIGLPGMDGYCVAQEIRSLEMGKQVLLVAVTGYGQDEDRRRTQAAGFDIHLVKPVSLDAITQVLKQTRERGTLPQDLVE